MEKSSARKFRGIACAAIIHLEAQISKLEDKPEIMHSDSVMIQAHTERLNYLDFDFKNHCFTIIELVNEDQGTLEREQALLDNHEDKATNMMGCLI